MRVPTWRRWAAENICFTDALPRTYFLFQEQTTPEPALKHTVDLNAISNEKYFASGGSLCKLSPSLIIRAHKYITT